MNNYSGIFLIFLCIVIIFAAGCTSQKESPASTPEPTPQPDCSRNPYPSHPRTIYRIIPQETTKPPSQKSDPTNVSEIKFLHYSDDDFSVDYPSTWNSSKFHVFPLLL